jgi:hypothetical protein
MQKKPNIMISGLTTQQYCPRFLEAAPAAAH